MLVYEIHDISIRLRRGFEANLDAEGLDELRENIAGICQVSQVNILPKFLDNFVRKFSHVASSVDSRNGCRRRVCSFRIIVNTSITCTVFGG